MVVQLSGVLDRQFGGGVKWPNLGRDGWSSTHTFPKKLFQITKSFFKKLFFGIMKPIQKIFYSF